MMYIVYIGVAVLALLFMITIHELGHYLVAKLLKFRVNEFAIGFGKAIFKRQSKKTGEIFSIRMIPLGGYCAFEGEDSAGSAGTKQTPAPRPADDKTIPYDKQPPWARIAVLFSGAFANLICGLVFCFILIACIGYYQTVTITKIDPEADNLSGIIFEGDRIIAVNGEKMTLLSNYSQKTAKFGVDEKFNLTLVRGATGATETVTVSRVQRMVDGKAVRDLGLKEGIIGYEKVGFAGSLGKSFVLTKDLAFLILSFLGKMVIGQVSLKDMGGTFTTIAVMSEAISYSAVNLLILIPLISINLAIFNWLPIPALDGSRMVFVLIEWVRGKPVNPVIENRIHTIGLLLLLGFVLFLDLNYLILSRF